MDRFGGVQGNTYVLAPEDDERFQPSKVQKVIKDILDERLKTAEYDPNTASSLVEELTKLIRIRVKELKMPRYKILIQVVLGQIKGQAIRISSKGFWDVHFDNYASYSFQNEKIHATGLVFGCYYE